MNDDGKIRVKSGRWVIPQVANIHGDVTDIKIGDLAKVAGQNGHTVGDPSPLVMDLDFALNTGGPTLFELFSEGLNYESVKIVCSLTVGGVQQVICSLL